MSTPHSTRGTPTRPAWLNVRRLTALRRLVRHLQRAGNKLHFNDQTLGALAVQVGLRTHQLDRAIDDLAFLDCLTISEFNDGQQTTIELIGSPAFKDEG